MATYHLYFLRNGRLIGAEDVEASSDLEAVRAARLRGSSQSVEIWHDHRRVLVAAPWRSTLMEARR